MITKPFNKEAPLGSAAELIDIFLYDKSVFRKAKTDAERALAYNWIRPLRFQSEVIGAELLARVAMVAGRNAMQLTI